MAKEGKLERCNFSIRKAKMKRLNGINWDLLYAIFFICILLEIPREILCVNISRIDVETPMVAGEGGWLRCDWDESGDDTIYTLKWYWGVHEFYRWTPSARNRVIAFKIRAFKVDKKRSFKGHVYIKNVTLRAARIVRCEASGEGPRFHTDFREAKLEIIDLPDRKPQISGARPVYKLHQNVHLTCTSPRSKPAADLTFYVNGEKAHSSWLTPHQPHVDPVTSLETAALGIKFPLSPRILQAGKVAVKCAASLGHRYWDSTEKVILADFVFQASRMEGRATEEEKEEAEKEKLIPASASRKIKDSKFMQWIMFSLIIFIGNF